MKFHGKIASNTALLFSRQLQELTLIRRVPFHSVSSREVKVVWFTQFYVKRKRASWRLLFHANAVLSLSNECQSQEDLSSACTSSFCGPRNSRPAALVTRAESQTIKRCAGQFQNLNKDQNKGISQALQQLQFIVIHDINGNITFLDS